MLQKSLGYAINKFGKFYKFPEKIVIYKKIKNYKISAMKLSSNWFIQNFFLIQNFDYRSTNAKVTGFLPYIIVKYITCLLDRG